MRATTLRYVLILSMATGFVSMGPDRAAADLGDDELNIFGYFQASWLSSTQISTQKTANSFNLQQLNLMAQRDIGEHWSAFMNLEMVNSYSSELNWGGISLREAWLRWDQSHKFRLKVGLLIPRFNHLNEIKNQMPVLPYIVRPLVYEASLGNVIALEEFVPQRANIQADGFLTAGIKWDYAGYLGNTSAVNSDPSLGQTGQDTTGSVMVGGRVGGRLREFRLGVSATYQTIPFLKSLEDTLGGPPGRFDKVPQVRLGVDFSFDMWRFDFESEYISVTYDEDAPEIDLDKSFFYVTLGYHISERWYIYWSLWNTRQHFNDLVDPTETLFIVDTVGASFSMNERITFKAQVGTGTFETDRPGTDASDSDFDFFGLAASVFF